MVHTLLCFYRFGHMLLLLRYTNLYFFVLFFC